MAKILIVDDSQTQIQSLVKILSKNGHETITAEDGDSAVAVARDELPDLILMDVVMPGLNGFQATRHITKTEGTQHIPVIILSSKDQETDKVWAMRQGAKDYIVKPVKEKALIEHVNMVLSS